MKALTMFLNNTGLSCLTLQSDGEPAVLQVAQRVRAMGIPQVDLRCSPHGSPQSNGSAENAGARIDVQVRAMLGSLESKSGVKVTRNLWAVRHSA